jgi:hypothetical protein
LLGLVQHITRRAQEDDGMVLLQGGFVKGGGILGSLYMKAVFLTQLLDGRDAGFDGIVPEACRFRENQDLGFQGRPG